MSWRNINNAWYGAQEQHADRDGNSGFITFKYTISLLYGYTVVNYIKMLNNWHCERLQSFISSKVHRKNLSVFERNIYTLFSVLYKLWSRIIQTLITIILHLEIFVSNIIQKTAQPNTVPVNTNVYLHFDLRVIIPLSTYTVRNMAKWK